MPAEKPANTDEMKGRAKQAGGKLIGDEELEREGELDEDAGKLKDAVDSAREKAHDAVDKVRDKLK